MFEFNSDNVTRELAKGFSDTSAEPSTPLLAVLAILIGAGVIYLIGKYYQLSRNLSNWKEGFSVFTTNLQIAQEKKEPFRQEYILNEWAARELGKHIDCFLRVTFERLFAQDYCLHIVFRYAVIDPKFRSLSDSELLHYIIQCIIDFYQSCRGVTVIPVYVKTYKGKALYLIIPLNNYGYRTLKSALDSQERFLRQEH